MNKASVDIVSVDVVRAPRRGLRRALPTLVTLALLGHGLGGCMVDLNTFELCERDPEACAESGGGLAKDPGCTATEPLQVEVGSGDLDFVSLADGEAPLLHEGTPMQAPDLHHVFLGVRIVNPDPVGRRFRVKLRAIEPDPNAGPGEPATRASVATLIMSKTLEPQPDGSLSRGGLRLFVYQPPIRLEAHVEDSCGREASDVHEVAAR